MALIVEDGTGVANADSYTSVGTARTYALKRGITLSAVDATLEVYLTKALDYLETLADRYKGTKVADTNALQWPRKDVIIDGVNLATNVIPKNLIGAQIMLAVAVQGGLELLPTVDGTPFIIEDTTGPLTTKYSEKITVSGVPIVRSADALLLPLLRGGTVLYSTRA